jgi:LuxR family transcriptional regulator, maltose regulon positive regulatory protein
MAIQKKTLLAKLTRPHLHDAVLRERLFARLEEERVRRRAICVVGPPGAGKTTLVASWLTKARLPGIWYQVDSGDVDPAAFFYYLGLAAGPFQRKGQKPLPLLTPEYLADFEGFARRYFRDLFARLPDGATLVLDNYQEVPGDQAFHTLVTQAIDELPPGVTLIAISRQDPPDCYVRLIANENVGFIDWDELKLTADEAKVIGAKRGISSDHGLESLYRASGGWAAGLTLMLERLKRGGESVERTQHDTREGVFRYFAGVVFERLSPEGQHLLLTTAILPRVNAQLAELMSGQAGAAHVLEQFYRQRLFIDRRKDGTDTAYQYHALFREFLLERGRGRFGPGERVELIGRAAAMLERNGEAHDATSLYSEVGNWQAVYRIIVAEAANLLGKGRWKSLLEWLALLPPEQIEASGGLRYWRGMAHLASEPAAAREELEASRRLYEQANDAAGQLSAIVGILSTHFVQDNSLANYGRWIDPIAELFERIDSWPTSAIELEARSMFLMAGSHLRPSHPLLHSTALRVLSLLDDDRIDSNTCAAGALRALVYFLWTGQVDLAGRVDGKLDSVFSSGDALAVHIAMGYAFRGLYQHLTLSNSAAASRSVEQALSIARENGLANAQSMASQFQGIVYAALGRDLDLAQTALQRVAALGFEGNLNKETTYHLARACLHKWRGDKAGALRHAELSISAARENCPAFLVIVGSNLVNVYADAAEYTQARSLVEEVRGLIQESCLDNFGAALDLEEAYLALRQNNRVLCHDRLRAGLRLSQENARRAATLHYMCGSIPALFAEALRSEIETDYVCKLIGSWEVPAPTDAPVNWPFPLTVLTLGKFEVRLHGKPLEFGRKVPRKVLELLKAVIALGGEDVAIERIYDALWPDLEADAAHGALATTLYRLRKIVPRTDWIVLKDAKLSLDLKACRVDALFLDSLPSMADDASEAHNQIAALYHGTFLPGDGQAAWLVPMQERLRRKFIVACSKLGRDLETVQGWDKAITLYSRAIDTDDLAEELYQRLMYCHLQARRHAEAASVFRRLRTRLSVILGLAPSPASIALFDQARATVADR